MGASSTLGQGMEVPLKSAALLLVLLLASSAACLAVRGAPQAKEPYKPQTIFRNGGNDPAAGIGAFIPGDGYGFGRFIGAVPLVGFVPAMPGFIQASGSEPAPPLFGSLPVRGRMPATPGNVEASASEPAPPRVDGLPVQGRVQATPGNIEASASEPAPPRVGGLPVLGRVPATPGNTEASASEPAPPRVSGLPRPVQGRAPATSEGGASVAAPTGALPKAPQRGAGTGGGKIGGDE